MEDSYGNRYSNDYSTFIEAASNINDITIDARTQIISGTNENNYAFHNCNGTLQSVTFPSNSDLRKINPYAFYYCTKLQSIDFSPCSKLESIDVYAFFGSSLTRVTFNEGLQNIGRYAFCMNKLASVHFPKTISSIGGYSFSAMPSLVNVTYAKDCVIENLDSCIFEYAKFTVLHIPPHVINFNPVSVWNIDTITDIVLDGGECEGYYINNSCLYSKNSPKLVYYPKSLNINGEYVVPEGTVTLDEYSFASAKLTTVILPNTLEQILSNAFRTAKITNITFPENVYDIRGWMFFGCDLLTNITFLTTKLTTLPERFVSSTGFTEFYVPDGITTIGPLCFSGCKSLISISLPESVTTIQSGAFSLCHENLKVTFRGNSSFVMDETFTFLLDSEWKSIKGYFGNTENHEFVLFDTIENIGQRVFADKTNIRGINISSSSSLTTIEDKAFAGCSNLLYFNIFSNSLKTVGKEAFRNCVSLQSFSFGNSIELISSSAFRNCNSLKTVKVGISNAENPLTSSKSLLSDEQSCIIDENCFSSCINLTNIEFGDIIIALRKYCFSSCSSLKTINFPPKIIEINESVFTDSGLEIANFSDTGSFESITNYSFNKAKYLNQIVFPNNLTSIGRCAFAETSLENVTIPKSVISINDGAFQDNIKLTYFNIPQGSLLEHWGYGVLKNCSNLQQIISYPDNRFIVENDALFDSDRQQLFAFPPASTIRFFYLPQTVTIIQQYSFYGCRNLRFIMIPESSVSMIGAYAFQNCENLTTINIPDSVTDIGINAFAGCKNLRCGVVVDNNTKEFLNTLFQKAQLNRQAIKMCAPQMSCHYNSYSTIKSAAIFAIFLMLKN